MSQKNISADDAAAKKRGHKKRILIPAIILSILLAFSAFLMVWYLADNYDDFDAYFTEEFEIPGLDDGFIPQGLGSYADDNTFFVSGYMNKGGASRIYVVKDGTSLGYITVNYADGDIYDGHACGVATDGETFWLVSEQTVFELEYDEVVNNASEEGGNVTMTDSWDPYCNADFCYVSGNYLYVGEFYREGNYETDESHRFETDAGDSNTAIIVRFEIGSQTPYDAYSITERIQGMAVSTDGTKMALSQSYGLSDSHILIYDLDKADTDSSKLKLGETTVDVKYLDSLALIEDYAIPSMSEGMCTVGDKVYVLFESASDKYKLFVRERLYNVYSFGF